ncbi:glial cell line-derived neurotrophic factor [Alosa alosa]|uniref:glial cell line-derived neurotrophic factor n=1 Tax=Alosa alosa TaxID=278164 RepID=UPI0020152CCA|nr:glial cell line-derived neurotrophic factor [Alosa alosa]
MKLWKGATLAILLCCASLCVLLTKPAMMPAAMPPTPAKQRSWVASLMAPPLPLTSSPTSLPTQSSTSSSPPRSARMGGLRRRARSADNVGSLLSEFTYLFQSFTEGELKQIVSALVDRKSRQDGQEQEDDARSSGGPWSSEDRQSRRTKRARKDQRPCALREVHRTVSELGLGYESDEMVVFRYCSGRCTARRRHYDMVLEHMQRAGQLDDISTSRERKGRGRKDKARYSPCCRPTRYEKDMSFFGNNNIFYTIPDVSARECGCV